jgi:Tfp pilus assembly protein PilO
MTGLFYILTISLPLAVILIAVALWYRVAVLKARARLENDDAYKRIAEGAASAQTETAAALSAIQASLADMRGRLESVEKVLKDVG